MAQNGLWNITKKRMLEDRGVLPKEEGDRIGENKAMHEESFVSSWLREDMEGKTAEVEEMNKRAKEEEAKSEKKEKLRVEETGSR